MAGCTSCHKEFEGAVHPDSLRAGNFYCDLCLGRPTRWSYTSSVIAQRLGWTIQDYYDHDRIPPGVTTPAARQE